MDMQDTLFDDKIIEKYGIGAGIIPITIDPNNNIRILLAKERFVPNWKGSFRWSGFEGAKKDNETMVETAIRELKEESLGIVKFDYSIEDTIHNKSYVARVVINIHQDNPSRRYHSTFLLNCEWNPQWISEFDVCKSKLNALKTMGEELQTLDSKKNIPHQLSNVGTLKHVTDVVFEKQQYEITFETTEDESHTLKVSACVQNDVFYNWFCKRKQLTTYMEDFEHDAVSVTRDANGLILQLTVDDDHLEKERIHWWAIDDLANVLKCKGTYYSEQFRACFMPVLQTIVERFNTGNDTNYCIECRDDK
tara:strand:- start:378 stop:1298 length:921 start_codon:yes stop_codon:yes gene_type:complete